jgi:acylphosphatase
MTDVRYDVTFIGHVQGVWFRATAEEVARGFDVAGYVRNQSDGSVRLVAEGEPDELDRFVEAVREAKRNNIADVRIDRTDATGEFDGFSVRR